MRNTINYDWETFDKVLMKIKDLLEKEELEILPNIEVEGPKNPNEKFMEFYNNSIRVPIDISINGLGDEIWEIQIISISDGARRYHGRANVTGNGIACEIYRLYKEAIEKPEIDIDDYVDSLFDWSRCSDKKGALEVWVHSFFFYLYMIQYWVNLY